MAPEKLSCRYPFYHYPCMILSSVGVLVKNSAEELGPFIVGVVDDMKSADYGKSDIAEVSCKQLSNTLALVSMHAIRFSSDGDQIGEGVTTYTFTKVEDSWKIAVLAPHDPQASSLRCFMLFIIVTSGCLWVFIGPQV